MIAVFASAALYFLGTLGILLFRGAPPISYLFHLVSVALLALAAIFSSKRPAFLGVIAAFYFVTLINTILYTWSDWGIIGKFLSNFLPLNLALDGGELVNFFFDLQLIALIVGIATHFIFGDSAIAGESSSQISANPVGKTIYQAPSVARVSTRAYSNIEGDAVVQVQKLGELRKQGLITDEEFEFKKKQILGL